MFKVVKKNGQQEDFDRNKILNGVVKSGATPEEAEKVTAQIETWLPGVAVEGVVKTVDLRNKILEMMRIINPIVASDFENYQKPAAV